MPDIYASLKNYVIESEDDIPQTYREEIEKRLNHDENIKQTENPQVIPGKRGKAISDNEEMNNVFKDDQVLYFGHGTSGGPDVIDSILQNGLKTVNPEEIKFYGNTLRGLDSTTIAFGKGREDLFDEQKNLLDNWPHKDSKDIVIVAIPKEYTLRTAEVGYADLYEVFYLGSKKDGYRLRPEFIKGIYNADSHTIVLNNNFYQNLANDQQTELYSELKKQYINSYAEYSMVAPEKIAGSLPLNETELKELTIEWYKVQLERLRNDKTFDTQMLDTQLYDMAESSLASEIGDTTRFIKSDAQQEIEDKNEGWSIDDDWE